jgi:uncharacterized protein involved in outer membrane biogenesis
LVRLRRYWKFGAALVLLLIAAQVTVNLVLRANRVRQSMIARLERTFGRRVEVRVFTFSLLPLPSLDADGITVGEDPAFGNEYFLRADRLSARLRMLGLLRGRFEFGTLSLDRPSLILVKNEEGRWNLERWLPPASSADPSGSRKIYGPQAPDVPTNRLAKIDISDGRLNFKLGDEKKPFAFTNVNGSIEQMAFGRWQINLEAQPWRSGVQLQTTGTIQVRGEVAGTSVRLRPARLQIRWTQASLADLVRLARGQDEGVRGIFDLEATAESGTKESRTNTAPSEWTFSLEARASQIHRWDLTQRADNPRLDLRWKGRWFPSDGTINIEEMLISAPKSNLRGTAALTTVPQTHFVIRVDSAGIQASDALAWYRAFEPGVAEGVSAEQYFTGGATFSGWPLKLEAAAFSSLGGRISVPGFPVPSRVGPAHGGTEKNAFVIEPVTVSWSEEKSGANKEREAQKGKSAAAANSIAIGLRYDFDSREGSVSLSGQAEKTESVLKTVAAFGKQLDRGWEWKGPASASLHRDWGNETTAGWNGQIEFLKGDLEIAGLNQPVIVKDAFLRWEHGKKSVALQNVEAFGGEWSGEIAENKIATEGEPRWRFRLHADSLSAADMDRWAGPRARPGWLQRLLPAVLGGSTGQNVDASDLLRRVDAEGEVSLDEFALDKLKLKQVHAQASLRDLHLRLQNCQAQWAGGTLQGNVAATFDAKPVYEVKLQANGLNLAQVPLAGKVADRMLGTLGGTLELKTEGVGRDALLDKLKGEGRIQLKKVEFRGWDVQASFAAGTPHVGASRWTDGEGFFHVSERSLEVNHLRLRAPQQEVSLKGSVSFGRETDLTLESATGSGKTKAQGPERVMQISGPLEGPKVAIQTVSAQQPGD